MNDLQQGDGQGAAWPKLGADACRHAQVGFERLAVIRTWDVEHNANAVYAMTAIGI